MPLIGRVACAHILCGPAINAILEPTSDRPPFTGCHPNLLRNVPLFGCPKAPGLVNRSFHSGIVAQILSRLKWIFVA